MKLLPFSPAKALLPAYRVRHVERSRLERFKTELARLFEHAGHVPKESEEHHKNIVSDFLKGAYYRDEHYINTKEKQDLVIHNGRNAKDSVGVIIETKRPGNKAEMVTADKPNVKALQELLRYYLDERIGLDNKEIRHLIVTDIYVWYIFDAADFERHIYANKKLQQQYADWKAGRLGASSTDWFYTEIAAAFFEKELPELRCCTFDLRDFADIAANEDLEDDEKLLDLYKVLSPEHLLKKPFANDSNALNKHFYEELLYILGLEEVKEGGKKLISRATKRRHDGSLLENTLSELEVSGTWREVTNLDQFGDTAEEQRYSIALELCITWLNRILFLKLLEGQLIRWRGGDRLLSVDKVKDYDELNELFFHVLAVPENERRDSVQQQFGAVPYLNSSLFEQTELERRTLRMSGLKDRLDIPVLPNSVLRQSSSAPERMRTMYYLFAFLDAYDFSSDAKARIQADHRAVINASVLGLIFEKINGYRDGSFFTPGFITMYMCRETLRRAVLQKFNERYGWDCQNVETELYNELRLQRVPPADANATVNSLRVCDPAVGSGHFLVSALNELIAVKSDLGILCDPAGRLLPLHAVVGNDELILTDPETDQSVEYRPGNTASQRIQETLFHEKQTLIENCLFGVDINPKSVMICRLRLWIELLKHAYFRADSQYQRLETLPNIDINIKTGNSLVSRFALDEDLKDVFAKGQVKATDYRLAVAAYKNATDKTAKAALLEQIGRVKAAIYEAFYLNNPLNKKLNKLKGDRFLLENKAAVGDLFEKLKTQDISDDLGKITREISGLETRIDELKQGKTYRNSFEWRFEFPEVLDEDGRYVGFDAVLGNPPYIRQEELGAYKSYLQSHYETSAGTADLYVYFVERGMNILRPGGQFSYILPNKWMRAGYGDKLRRYVKGHRIEGISDFGDLPVFEEATTYPCILEMRRSDAQPQFPATLIDTLLYDISLNDYIRSHAFSVGLDGLGDSGWTLSNRAVQLLLDKLRAAGTPLGEYVQGKIYYGIKTGLNEAFVIDAATRERLIAEDPNSAKVIKPFLAGRDIKRYQTPVSDKYLILLEKGVTNRERGPLAPEAWIQTNYPAIFNHFAAFEEKAKARYDKGDYWWELRACEYYGEFEKPKIFFAEIATEGQFTIDVENQYCDTTGYIIDTHSKYIIGILNSRLVTFFFSKISSEIRGGFFRWKRQYVEQIPICNILEESQHSITSLVTQILAAKQSASTADTAALEAEVDGLVYGLYGLTEAEIGIVEGRDGVSA